MPLVPSPRTRAFFTAGLFAAIATAALAQPQQPPAQAPTPAPAPATPAQPPADFAVCSACHETTANGRPSLGPNLFGVGGRKAGGAADYDYSPAMKASTTIWSADTLAAFIADPNKAVPGNKMDYPGADPAAAKAIADYLMTLK